MDLTPDRDVNAEQLGSWLAISAFSIRELAARGITEKTGRNRYALKSSIRRYAEHKRRLVTGRGDGTAAAGRARLASAQAGLVETKMKRLRGELLDCDTVQRTWCGIFAAPRARPLAVPSRVQQVASHSTAHDVATLNRKIRGVLTELTTRPPCGPPALPPGSSRSIEGTVSAAGDRGSPGP
jgi:phage terminase Nu1 subunit (DNA packaging protein)